MNKDLIDKIISLSKHINDNFNQIDKEQRDKDILFLCKNYISSDVTANIVIENFKFIEEDSKNEFLNLAKNPLASKNIAEIFNYKYYNLPSNYRNILLSNLDINKDSVKVISNLVLEAFKKIDEDISSNIIMEISKYQDSEYSRFKILKYNFNQLNENIKNTLLIDLSKIDKLEKKFSIIVRENINNISPKILGETLFNLVSQRQYTKYITYTIRDYFYLIPDLYKEKIINKLSEKTENLKTVFAIIIRNYNLSLSKDFCSELISKLSNQEQALWGITGFVIKHFDNIDEQLKNDIIIKISKIHDSKQSINHLLINKNFQLEKS